MEPYHGTILRKRDRTESRGDALRKMSREQRITEYLRVLGWKYDPDIRAWLHTKEVWGRLPPLDASCLIAQAIEWLVKHHGFRGVEAAFHRAADDADTGELLLWAVLEPPVFCVHGEDENRLCEACEE